MDTDIIQRINELINILGLSKNKFAEKSNINQANLSQMLLGKRTIGDAIINKISISFDINKDWILNGKGDVFNKQKHEAIEIDPNIIMIPLVSQYAYAGYMHGYSDAEYVDSLPKIPVFADHKLKGEYKAFEVRGDSMFDGSINSLCEGDRLICRQIKQDLWQYKLHMNQWNFVIVHKIDGILVKRITNHDTDKGTIKLHSLNPDPIYEDFEVNLNDVAQMFNVVEIHRSGRL